MINVLERTRFTLALTILPSITTVSLRARRNSTRGRSAERLNRFHRSRKCTTLRVLFILHTIIIPALPAGLGLRLLMFLFCSPVGREGADVSLGNMHPLPLRPNYTSGEVGEQS